MSAPRVPAGWTREAADLVWEDWWRRALGCTAIIMVNDPRPLGEIEDLLDDPRLLADDILVVTSLVSGMGFGIENTIMDSGEILVAWRSVNDALRAWAAVGAPVLAPAEDGKPSLAEWVAAAEGSALGRPSWSAWKAFFSRPHRHRIDCELLDDGSALVTDWGDHFSQWAAMPFSTPAELRACLDRLAGGVS